MNKIKFFKTGLLFAVLSVLLVNCSKDDSPIETIITTADITKSIDENSAQGTVVGTVTGTSNTGTVAFSITTQTPNGALAINATTGELTIADATIFDFETNPKITAIIRVTDGEVTNNSNITVNLTDKDDLEFLLSTSKIAYTNTSDNNWVEITATEYDNLAGKLNNISRTSASEADFDSSVATEIGGGGAFTSSNINTSATVPNAGYVFAFKYVLEGSSSSISNSQVKQSSTSNYQGFANLGSTLPSHTNNGTTKTFYFVLKGNTIATTATGYISLSSTTNVGQAFKRIAGTSYYYSSVANQNTLFTTIYNGGGTGVRWLRQGLVTTQKQW